MLPLFLTVETEKSRMHSIVKKLIYLPLQFAQKHGTSTEETQSHVLSPRCYQYLPLEGIRSTRLLLSLEPGPSSKPSMKDRYLITKTI